MQIPLKGLDGAFSGNKQKSPRRAGGLCITAPSVPSTCSELAALPPPQKPRAAQWPRWPGSGLAFFLAPFHQALFTSTISRSAGRGGGFEEEEEEEEGGKYRSLV